MQSFDALVAECAAGVAPTTMRAIASVESGFNPFAIGVVNGKLKRQPRHVAEAVSTVHALRDAGHRFSAGLVQIYVGNWARLGLDHESVFEPCRNLQASAFILKDCYARALQRDTSEQGALRKALSCYYSNNFVTGFDHGYVQKVVAAAQKFAHAGAKVPAVHSGQQDFLAKH